MQMVDEWMGVRGGRISDEERFQLDRGGLNGDKRRQGMM